MQPKTVRVLAIVGVILIVGILYYGLSPLWQGSSLEEPSPLESETSPSTASTTGLPSPQASVVKTATIVDTPLHPANGSVSLLQNEEEYIIRYENLKTINGPDLYVYLSTDTNASDFINLGALKATEGSFNYTVPATVDITKYRYALIWCKQFGVLFNAADIGLN